MQIPKSDKDDSKHSSIIRIGGIASDEKIVAIELKTVKPTVEELCVID